MAARLSKSKLMAALQCERRLWLEVNQPDLASYPRTPGRPLPLVTRSGKWRGTCIAPAMVRASARVRRGLGAALRLRSACWPIRRITGRSTRRRSSTRASWSGWTCCCGAAGVHLIEVKSSTSLKQEHLSDCAIQAWVARGAGGFERRSLAHIDNASSIAVTATIAGCSGARHYQEVEALQASPDWLAAARLWRWRGGTGGPPGKRCVTPYACPFMDHCWPGEAAYPVQGLGGDRERLASFFAAGSDLRDVPAERLTRADQKRIQAVTFGRPRTRAGGRGIRAGPGFSAPLSGLRDLCSAVPLFAGTRPYEALPFQFSCHVQQRMAGSNTGAIWT